jgi:hypothetical protein
MPYPGERDAVSRRTAVHCDYIEVGFGAWLAWRLPLTPAPPRQKIPCSSTSLRVYLRRV